MCGFGGGASILTRSVSNLGGGFQFRHAGCQTRGVVFNSATQGLQKRNTFAHSDPEISNFDTGGAGPRGCASKKTRGVCFPVGVPSQCTVGVSSPLAALTQVARGEGGVEDERSRARGKG